MDIILGLLHEKKLFFSLKLVFLQVLNFKTDSFFTRKIDSDSKVILNYIILCSIQKNIDCFKMRKTNLFCFLKEVSVFCYTALFGVIRDFLSKILMFVNFF